MARISAKHALTDQELDYCRRRAAGLANATAYRRAFLVEYKGKTYAHGEYGKNGHVVGGVGDNIDAKEVSRRAGLLAKQEHIRGYMEEMGMAPGERARDVLTEQVMFADETGARQAAKQILEQEDKLGFRDAVGEFWIIACEVGADIVVPLPERFKKSYRVPCKCGELVPFTVDEPLELTVPVTEMFGGGKKKK